MMRAELRRLMKMTKGGFSGIAPTERDESWCQCPRPPEEGLIPVPDPGHPIWCEECGKQTDLIVVRWPEGL